MKIRTYQIVLRKTKKFLLGIFLALLCLEILLRLYGFALRTTQTHRNNITLARQYIYKIMCIGESTTDRAYPRHLEEELNKNKKEIKFCVIDKGVGATDTTYIYRNLQRNIEEIQPAMVIAMIGINDGALFMPEGFNSDVLCKHFKVFKVVRWLFFSLSSKKTTLGPPKSNTIPTFGNRRNINIPPTPSLEKWQQCIAEGMTLKASKEHALAEAAFLKAISIRPYKVEPYFELTYLNGEKEIYLRKIIEKYINHLEINTEIATDIINDFPEFRFIPYTRESLRNDMEKMSTLYLSRFPDNTDAMLFLAKIYIAKKDYTTAQKQLDSAIANGDTRAYDILSVTHHELGNTILSEKYLRLAKKARPENYSELTINNYRDIKRLLDKNNVQLVCMQYPLRSIEKLRDIFPEKEKNTIIFVNNEHIFKDALKRHTYEDIFHDQFAGDFGHCTDLGNKLIAKNLAKIILNNFNKRLYLSF